MLAAKHCSMLFSSGQNKLFDYAVWEISLQFLKQKSKNYQFFSKHFSFPGVDLIKALNSTVFAG